ncbi:MAG: Ribosomal RNA adenine dimethylase domain protein, partial [uncultured Sphingomonas sp.]
VRLVRPYAEGASPPCPPQLGRGDQPAPPVPARVPEASGDGRLRDPVQPQADRPHAGAGGLGQYQTVRGIWPGRGHLHPSHPGAARPRRDPRHHRYQSGLHRIPAELDRRRPAAGRDRVGGGRGEDPCRPRLRLRGLCAVGPPLLDPAAGCRRGHWNRHLAGDPRRGGVSGLSVQPQGPRFHRPGVRADRTRLRMGQRSPRDAVLGVPRAKGL